MEKIKKDDFFPNFSFESPWKESRDFFKTVGNNTACIIFLRYIGCMTCQLKIRELTEEISLFDKKRMRAEPNSM